MGEWVAQLNGLPEMVLGAALAVVMLLDAIPIVGIMVPADLAILTAMGVSGPVAASGALLWVVGGCVAGWSLGFLAGRFFGERIRAGKLGRWVGEARWAAADRALDGGGGRVLIAAPFLPVVNTLVPIVAGGLRMPYGRFLKYAALGGLLWGGLYIGLGVAANQVGRLMPGGSLSTVATLVIGFAVGSLVLLGTRRRLRTATQMSTTPSDNFDAF